MTKENIPLPSVTDSSADFASFAMQSAGIGTWEIDLVNQLVRWDKRCQELYGLLGHDEIAYEKLWPCVYPDDQLLVEQARDWSLDTRSGGHYDIRFRTIGADTGQLRWIRCQGRAYFQPDGKAYRVVGIAQDVTNDQPTRRELTDPTRLDKLAAALSGLGVYYLNLLTDELIHSTGFASILTGNGSATLTRAVFSTALHPQDTLLRQAALEDAARTGVLLYEPRFIWPDGTIHHTRIVGAMHWNELGKPAFIVGYVTEINQSTIRQPDTEIRFQTLIRASPVAMGLFQGADLVVETANEAMYRLLNGERALIGKPLLTALPHWQEQPFVRSLQQAYITGEASTLSHQLISSWEDGQLINRHYTYHYTPILDNQRTVYAVLVTALDITEQMGAKKRLEVSEARFRSIIEHAPMSITLMKGRSMILEAANATALKVLGTSKSTYGLPIGQIFPEMEDQGFIELLEGVFDSGLPLFRSDAKFQLRRNNKQELFYLDLAYMPLRDNSDAVTGVMLMATNVTERVLARQAIEASDAKLKDILNAAPIAMCLHIGRDKVVGMANQTYIDIIGKGPDVIGKPLHTLMPELANQPYLQIIDTVYTTGEPFERFGAQINILRHGVMTHDYYNLNYSPLRDASGQIYAVLSVGTNVTKEIKRWQKLEESERHYRQLAETLSEQVQLLQNNQPQIANRT